MFTQPNTSLQKLPYHFSTLDRIPPNKNIQARLNRSVDSFDCPFEKPAINKFPKNRSVRRQASSNMHSQTQQYEAKASVRVWRQRNSSVIFEDDPDQFKRVRGNGQFHSRSLQSVQKVAQNRSIQDLGVAKNRRGLGVFRDIKNDPILIGEQKNQIRSYLKKIQEQPRRHRDNGNQIKTHLKWEPCKPKTYLQRFRATRKL